MLPIKNLLEHKYLTITAIVFQLGVTILMLMPTSGLPSIEIPYIDKLIHFGIYAVFFLLWGSVFFKAFSGRKRWLGFVFSVLLFYGMVIEFIQGRWIPDRTFDWMDMLANLLGLLMGLVAFYVLKPLWTSKK